MKGIAVIWLLASVLVCESAVAENTIHRLLRSAQLDALGKPGQETNQLLKSAVPDTPLLNRFEFRAETEENDESRQQYALRLYPRGWEETKSGKDVHWAMLQSTRTELDLRIHQELAKRYLLIIDSIFEIKLLVQKKRLSHVFADRISVLSRQALASSNGNVDIDDLIDSEDDQAQLNLELIALENSIKSREAQISRMLRADTSLNADTDYLPDVSAIQALVQNTQVAPNNDNVYLQNGSARVALTESQYRLEKAEDGFFIRYFEAAYERRPEDDDNAYTLGFGIRMPIGNANRLDTNRRHLRQLREKGQYNDLVQEIADRLNTLSGDLIKQAQQYRVLTKKRDKQQASETFDFYRHLEGVNPLILLKLRENSIQNEIDLANLTHGFYTTYVQWLDISGLISKAPLRNYLSREMEVIPEKN